MENLVLFSATFIVYFVVSCWLKQPGTAVEKQPALFMEYVKRGGLVALLCIPFSIKDNVITVLGNAVSQKNIISLCSIYQRAQGDTTALVFSGWQSAGRDAITGIISVYQRAGSDAVTGIFSMYQKAGRDAGIGIGFAGYQSAKRNAVSPLARPVRLSENSLPKPSVLTNRR